MTLVQKDVSQLTEWNVLNLGRFVEFVPKNESSAVIYFEHETLDLFFEEDDRSGGEYVASVSIIPTLSTNTPTDLELANFDMYTRGITFTLTNGAIYGLEVDYEDEDEDEFSDGTPNVETASFTIIKP